MVSLKNLSASRILLIRAGGGDGYPWGLPLIEPNSPQQSLPENFRSGNNAAMVACVIAEEVQFHE